MQENDKVITELLSHHHEKGMEILFNRYYKPLVIYANRILNNIPDSEDLVQTFFVKIWEKSNSLSLQAQTLKSFLYISIRNMAFDKLEKKDPLKNTANFCNLEIKWEEYDTGKEEMFTIIEQEIELLPLRSREIIQCIYLQGFSYKETAEYLGVSISTVNTLLVNTLKKIRKKCIDSQYRKILLFFLLKK